MTRALLVAGVALLAGAVASPPAFAAPAVTVLPRTTGLDPAGQALTVRGSGFSRDANGGVGIYVVFGPKGDDYSTNADRYQAAKWVRSAALGGSGQGELRADGTFEVTLPGLKAKYLDGNGELVDCYRVQCLVMTFTAHGVPDRGNDTFTGVSFTTGKPAPVGRATVPYRPSRAPAATPTAAATRAPGAATATPSPARAAAAAPATQTPATAAASTPPAAPATAAAAEPVPLPRDGAGAAPFAGVVVAGLGTGAAVTYGVRRRTRGVAR